MQCEEAPPARTGLLFNIRSMSVFIAYRFLITIELLLLNILRMRSDENVKYLCDSLLKQIGMIIIILSATTACNNDHNKKVDVPVQPVINAIVAETTVLATIPASGKLYAPNAQKGGGDTPRILINDHGKGSAYIMYEGDNVHVVHNGHIGKAYKKIDNLSLSPDGKRVAYGILINEKRCIVLDGREGAFYVDVWDPIFSPDNRHIAYIAQIDDKSHIVIDDRITDEAYPSVLSGNPVFSGDSSKVAYHLIPGGNRIGRLIVSNLDLKLQKTWDCSNEELIANRDKTRIAIISPNSGKQRVLDINFIQPDVVKEGPLYDRISNVSFGSDGVTLTYVAFKGKERFLVMNGREELLPDGELRESPVTMPDSRGVGVLILDKDGFYLYQGFMVNSLPAKRYQEAAGLVYNKDCSQHAFIARTVKRIYMVVNGKEGPSFDMIVKPMFSPDGTLLIYRARKDGKRFVVVADRNGKTVRQHPSYEMVYDTVFTADSKSVAYGVKDGDKLVWKVEKL